MMLGCNKSGVNFETPMPDSEVVKSALEIDATHLHDAKASPLRTIVDR
jgi:hypothetical protein